MPSSSQSFGIGTGVGPLLGVGPSFGVGPLLGLGPGNGTGFITHF